MIHLFSRHPDSSGFSDEELQIAARAVRDSMLQSLEREIRPSYSFSDQFLSRMRVLFQLDKHRNNFKRTLQHAAIILIGIFLAGAMLLAFNPEVRAEFVGWVRSLYENSIFYESFSRNEDRQPTTTPDIEFTWLPDDFQIQTVFCNDKTIIILLSGKEGTIVFEQFGSESADYTEAFSAGYKHEQTKIKGNPADVYWGSDTDNSNTLLWMNEDRSILYNLSGAYDVKILIKIAEGIVEK